MDLHSDLKFETDPRIDENNTFFVKTHEKYTDRTRMYLKNVDYWTEKPPAIFIGLFRKNGLSFLKCPKHNSEFFRVQQDGKELGKIQIGNKEGYLLNEVQNSNKSEIDLFFLCSTSCFRKKDSEINLHFEHIDKYKTKQIVSFRLYISQKPARSFKLLNKKGTEQDDSDQSPAKKQKIHCSKLSAIKENLNIDDFKTVLKKIVDQNDQILSHTNELKKRLDSIDIRLADLEEAVASKN